MSKLLSEIEAFLEDHNIAASTFGARALGDRHFVRQLRTGRRVWDDTAEKVRSFMRAFIDTHEGMYPGKIQENTVDSASPAPRDGAAHSPPESARAGCAEGAAADGATLPSVAALENGADTEERAA